MNNKKQSSIDFLLDKLPNSEATWLSIYVAQAKAMHKEEILQTFEKGYECGHIDNGDEGIDYYKETFGGQDNE